MFRIIYGEVYQNILMEMEKLINRHVSHLYGQYRVCCLLLSQFKSISID
jgi:hypothetical protein